MSEFSQEFPDYDNPVYSVGDEYAQGTTRSRSGKLSREGERRKKQKYRSRNREKYNAYMRKWRALRKSSPPDVY